MTVEMLKKDLKTKINERDELMENGADREDIINANIRIMELKSEITRMELKEQEENSTNIKKVS